MSFFPPGSPPPFGGNGEQHADLNDHPSGCPFCGAVLSWIDCDNQDCPGEVLQCEVITMHGSRNPDSVMYGPDERCENDVVPGLLVCEEHFYVNDEPDLHREPDFEPDWRARVYDNFDDGGPSRR